MERWSIDCDAETSGVLAFADYNADGSVGQTLEGSGRMNAIIPGSVADAVREAVCLEK
jgi:hypothetical protein